MKNTMKKVIGTVMVFALLFGLLAVPSQNAQAVEKESICLSDKKVKLKEGDTSYLQLYLRIRSQYLSGSQKTCQWTSSNSKVVKIIKKQNWGDIVSSGKGDEAFDGIYQFVHQVNFKALKKGNATITAKCGGKTWKAKVTVSEKKISITKNAKVTEGKTATIKLKNNKKKVTWKVAEGKECVEITKKSKTSATIKGIKTGTAKVQAVIAKKKYTCNVTVSANGAKPSTTSTPLTTQTPLPTASANVTQTTVPTLTPTISPNGSVTSTPIPTTSPDGSVTPTPIPTASPDGSVTPTPTTSPDGNVTPAPTSNPDVTSEVCTITYDGTNYGEVIAAVEEGPVALVIMDGVTDIGDLFSELSNLISVSIPSSMTEIGAYAFYGCSNLTEITIPSSVTEIGNGAFYGCSSLAEITIPSSVTKIGEGAFGDCSSLTEFTIPSGVTEIGEGTFYGCSSLTEVTIPSSVVYIGWAAFMDCNSLAEINLPSGDLYIEPVAFSGCSSLTEITIPSGVTYIGWGAFADCSLTAITVSEDNAAYDSRNNCNAIIEKKNNCLVCGCNNTVIPSDVKSIEDFAFSGCSDLIEAAIPSIVTRIGWAAFSGCSSITSVTIPDNLEEICDNAFSGCSGLTEIIWRGSTYESVGDVMRAIDASTNEQIVIRTEE